MQLSTTCCNGVGRDNQARPTLACTAGRPSNRRLCTTRATHGIAAEQCTLFIIVRSGTQRVERSALTSCSCDDTCPTAYGTAFRTQHAAYNMQQQSYNIALCCDMVHCVATWCAVLHSVALTCDRVEESVGGVEVSALIAQHKLRRKPHLRYRYSHSCYP